MPADLMPFGFTATESMVYSTLLRLGPATGYAVARAVRLARANAYGALDGLVRSEEHTSELQSRLHLVCRLLLEKKKKDNRVAAAVQHGTHISHYRRLILDE